MVSCYVFGCKSGNNSSKWHKFKISRKASEEVRKQWLRNIPKREDKEWDFRTCFICDLHFEPHFIVKVNQVIFNGEVMAQEERKHWTLTDDAVPTIFVNDKLPGYFNVTSKPRKPPVVRKPLQQLNYNFNSCNNSILEEENINPAILHEPHLAKTFHESFRPFLVPDNWFIQKSENHIACQKVVQDSRACSTDCKIEKAIKLSSSMKLQYFIRGKEVQFNCSEVISPLENMQIILQKFDDFAVCSGVPNFNGIKECQMGQRYGNRWYANSCPAITSEDVCSECVVLKSLLLKLGRKLVARPTQRANNKRKPLNIHNASRTIKRMKIRLQTKQERLIALRNQVRKLNSEKLIDLIEKETNIPPPMKSAILAAVRVAKAKSVYGHRYASDWLLQCLLIRISSPKNYRFLRNNKILALPHPKHLAKLIHGVPCRFGFTDFVFKELEKQFKGKDQQSRQFMLSFDEMKVRESVKFDKFTGTFMGYIDYAEFTEDYKRLGKNKSPEADHALVLMIRCMNSNVIQPIASFASRGAAPSHVLAKILVSAILKLEAIKCEVFGIVSDGSSTNQSLWNLFGITGDPEKVVSSIKNPHDEFRNIYFLRDVPHMIKCIRNHLQTHGTGTFQGKLVNWGFYEAVYDFDCRRDLRLAPKLTHQHLKTGPFQKMVVSYATQIVSKTVADAIKFHRENLGTKEFVGSEGTEAFTRTLNDVFDVLNAKLPHEGIRFGSSQYKLLETFFSILCESGSVFASDTTMDSLRVTLHSFIAIIRYLCEDLQYEYVLTAKCNQDCLERFFGLLRSLGGDDCHPSIITFGHLFRILSVFAPIKHELKGNIRSYEDTELCLDPFIDELKSLSKIVSLERKSVRSRHENELSKKVAVDEKSTRNPEDFELNQNSCIVYYLCGYLAHKGKTFTSCQQCQALLKADSSSLPVKEWTDLKSFGGLTYPSSNLYEMIREHVEPIVAFHLESLKIPDEFFLDAVIRSIPTVNVTDIGCSKTHSSDLAIAVILHYITTRCYFHQKLHNRERLISSVKRKNKMKQAKCT